MTRTRRWAPWIPALTVLAALVSEHHEAAGDRKSSKPDVDDLLICDCVVLKPRRFGTTLPSILGRGAPFRTTVQECKKRGGRYVLYSGSDRKAALEVWLPTAEKGDPEAQYNVGEIYERGLGVDPDYGAAAEWYRRAAEQGHKPAENNLAYLYEKGLGVEADPAQAVSWYRKASDAPETVVLSGGAGADTAAAGVRGLFEGPNIVVLLPPLIAYQGFPAIPVQAGDVMGRVTAPAGLRELRVSGDNAAVDPMGLFRTQVPGPAGIVTVSLLAIDRRGERSTLDFSMSLSDSLRREGGRAWEGTVDFGRYAALVVGNGSYAAWPAFPSGPEEARAVSQLLERRYGFRVRLLIDADRETFIRSLHEVGQELKPSDNLVVFFAGRGRLEADWLDGYWLPVDAVPDTRDTWVPVSEIIARANILPARKTLLIADAAFRQTRTASALPRVEGNLSDEARARRYQEMAYERTLVALTSGSFDRVGVADRTDPSVFARALEDVLAANNDILPARRLHAEVAARVALAAGSPTAFTEPECATIRGHEGGDFLFVPR